MKKLFAMLMALTILLTRAACGQQATDEAGGTVLYNTKAVELV